MNMTRRLSIALLLVLLLPLPALAQGVDFIYLAQQYGQNIVDTMHTEIMNDALRRSVASAQNPAPSREEAWPTHIADGAAASHRFSVEELIAMRYSDPDRMRALLDGQTITVYGQVRRADRADSSFRLVAPGDEGYGVYASWRRWSGALPEHGAWLELRGTFVMERRSYGTIRDGEIVSVGTTRPEAARVTTNPAAAAQAGTAADLTFTPDPAVSQAVMELVADTLAPTLTQGVSRADLLAALNSGQLQQAFAHLLAEQGFSTTDLADVMAAHLMIAWQVAHDEPEVDEVEGGNRIRDGVRDGLLQAAWLAYAEEAELQAMAEVIMLGTMLITSVYLHGMETGDAGLVAAAGEEARQMVLAYGGPDLLDYDFTSQGFVAR